ncbi:MAG: sulfatase-like hydrolase/transferase [Pseudomonadales bacterium]
MRRLIVVLVVLAGIAYAAYQQRLWLLLHVAPVIADLRDPIAPHREVEWSSGSAPAAVAGQRKPNIVLILADDLGYNDITRNGGVAGGSVPTPNIDALAASGVAFSNGYAGNAVCAPSRASIMTGRYPTRFGFEFTPVPNAMPRVFALMAEQSDAVYPTIIHEDRIDAMPDFQDLGMPPSEITIAEVLKSAGYQTAHIGKWHLGGTNGMRPEDQGFDDSLDMASGLYLPEDSPDVRNAKQPFDPIDQTLWSIMRYAASFNGGDKFAPEGYLTDYYTDQAVRVIEANRERPFFLYLAHWAVHTPLQASREDYEALSHIEDHRLRVYAAMVRALDRSVGRVLQALRDNGVDDNTLVIFTSDNGGANYIGLPDINRPYRGWKLTLFEGGTHVPFFMRWPGVIAPGSQFDAPVGHIDIMATAADAAGAELPTNRVIDGVDLLPYVTGARQGAPHEALFWREGYYQAVIADGWKLIVSGRPDRVWLFDMRSDPTEQSDQSAARPDKVAELQRLLAAHNAQQAEPAWPSMVESPVMIDKTLADPVEPGDEYTYWPN